MTLNLEKTWEMVVRGTTKKLLPEPMKDIERKEELRLLGVTLHERPCKWDTHIDHMITKASSRLYILSLLILRILFTGANTGANTVIANTILR